MPAFSYLNTMPVKKYLPKDQVRPLIYTKTSSTEDNLSS